MCLLSSLCNALWRHIPELGSGCPTLVTRSHSWVICQVGRVQFSGVVRAGKGRVDGDHVYLNEFWKNPKCCKRHGITLLCVSYQSYLVILFQSSTFRPQRRKGTWADVMLLGADCACECPRIVLKYRCCRFGVSLVSFRVCISQAPRVALLLTTCLVGELMGLGCTSAGCSLIK